MTKELSESEVPFLELKGNIFPQFNHDNKTCLLPCRREAAVV